MSPFKLDYRVLGQVSRWPFSAEEPIEEMQRQATDEGHGKEEQPSHHQGHGLSDPHSKATVNGAQIRDVKCSFAALRPDYS